MVRFLIVLWDMVLTFGGWCLYQNPRLLDKGEADSRQLRINKIGGIVVMILGLGCTVATLLLAFVKHSN